MPRGRPGVVADHQAPPPPPSPSPVLPRSPHRGMAITPQSPLRIKQDGKFYERLLSKESSAASAGGGGNLSFRYYWAEPGAVPFVWESQPGTPKDAARMALAAAGGALPAITPPPSYLLRHASHGGGQKAVSARSSSKKNHKRRRCRLKRIRIGFIAGIFRRLSLGTKRWQWQRPAAPPVKVSSSSTSSRWLFSSVASTDTGGEHVHGSMHHDEISIAANPRQRKAAAAGPCSFPTLWLLRFRNSSGGGRSVVDGCWA